MWRSSGAMLHGAYSFIRWCHTSWAKSYQIIVKASPCMASSSRSGKPHHAMALAECPLLLCIPVVCVAVKKTLSPAERLFSPLIGT